MRILERSVFVGPSQYAHFPVIRLELDLQALEAWPTARLGATFVDGLVAALPGLDRAAVMAVAERVGDPYGRDVDHSNGPTVIVDPAEFQRRLPGRWVAVSIRSAGRRAHSRLCAMMCRSSRK